MPQCRGIHMCTYINANHIKKIIWNLMVRPGAWCLVCASAATVAWKWIQLLFPHAKYSQSAQTTVCVCTVSTHYTAYVITSCTFVLALSCSDDDDNERQTYQLDKPNSFFSHIRFVSTRFFLSLRPLFLRFPLLFKLVNELRCYRFYNARRICMNHVKALSWRTHTHTRNKRHKATLTTATTKHIK